MFCLHVEPRVKKKKSEITDLLGSTRTQNIKRPKGLRHVCVGC